MNFENQWDNEDEGELEYQRELYEEKIERRRNLKTIYNKFIKWRTNFPHEVDIWEGDSRNAKIENEYSPKLDTWQEWLIRRENEDKLIEEAQPEIHIIKKLIDIDAISWGFNQFIHERKIDGLIKIINKWKNDNPIFMDDYNSFNVSYWTERDLFQQKAFEEYNKIMTRCLRFPNSTQKEFFLGHEITGEDVQRFLEMKHKSYLNGSVLNDFVFNLDDIRRLELWVNSNHFLDWDNWARPNTNWAKYVRNGYAHMYQKVWWQKYNNIKKYWECEDKAIPEGYNYNPEFKRRLVIDKLEYLHYSGGNVFNDGLAVIKENQEYGYIDTNGNIAIDIQFDEAREFVCGLAVVKQNAEEFNEYIPELNDYLSFKNGGQWGFINTKGTFIIQPKYEILSHFKSGIATYCKGAVLNEFDNNIHISNGGKWGLINDKGLEIIPPTYDFIKFLGHNILIANKGGSRDSNTGRFYGGLWCVLSREGNELSRFKYTCVFEYENGKAIVNAGGLREEVDGVTNYWNGEWGFINETGSEIEPLKEYCSMEEFKEEWDDAH